MVFNPILDHGDRSVQAHNAAECAGEQGKFWPMHDILFEEIRALYNGDVRATVKMLGANIGLDVTAFNGCIDEQRYVELVKNQDQQRRELGIRTRPTLDVNGLLIIGAQPFAAFETVIEPMLAE